ncbi:MAG: VWA domain-containing protein [Deltaproteobacteria bacterium]|nr:VWA domain-containing protein [Deltaproteobacteria bacterium]
MHARKLMLAAVGAALIAPHALPQSAEAKSIAVARPAPPPKIQVALLLDTSNSMDGLINQAKSELWSIVGRMSEARRGRRHAVIEVALFEYGKQSLPRGEGYVRLISPLTTDLDRISEELFALRTNGGDEWAGVVIDKATTGLTWSKSARDYKAIFIAGNEPFTQGPLAYQKAIAQARSNGIVINTIHCGDTLTGQRTGWAAGAELGGGRYMAINHNAVRMQIATPYDKEIARLNSSLNRTYVAYGRAGKSRAARQRAQDSNAATMGAGVAAERAATKAGRAYKNSGWDLVDGVAEGEADVAKLKKEELPAEMRKMNKAQRKRYIAKKAAERKRLQKRISKLAKKRKTYIANKRKAQGKANTLDKVMRQTVDSQLKAKGYRMK